jgi:hypothetical protein
MQCIIGRETGLCVTGYIRIYTAISEYYMALLQFNPYPANVENMVSS